MSLLLKQIYVLLIFKFLSCTLIWFHPSVSLAQPNPVNDRIIIPGKRVGPITHDTSETELRRLFGTRNVIRGEIPVGEGETTSGTIVFPNDPRKKLRIIWKNKNTRMNPQEFRFEGNVSMWRTDKGMSLGTSLQKIQQLNGKPFIIGEFGTDYSGTVFGSNHGRLKELGEFYPDSTTELVKGRTLVLRLGSENVFDIWTKCLERSTLDRCSKSDYPPLHKENPRVYEMIITLEPNSP